ncbi:solute carrier family 35 member F4 isoform X4 [Entelurus aequoreus]|uniref:solute carrier family 35 member F4 isoform X4 n=1 Tax=Entelurus aequoreus TaxID=161455 RepID=UPI002B1E4FDB|nr:solute carrier family 35 member F4 isoform X4 [Entelurus aequoreus]
MCVRVCAGVFNISRFVPALLRISTMTSTESVVEQPRVDLELLTNKNAHLPGKTTPSGGSGRGVFVDGDGPKVAANGVHDIEDRILRITGYYGYNPGYSSHRREDGLESHAETPGSETSEESLSYQTCTCTVLKVLGGLLMVLCVSSSWKLTATDVSALYCCHKAFVFLLSWIVLKDRFMGVRIVAAIMAITGIVMMAYADGFHGDSFVGVALAVGSASTSALYKVLFKMVLGSANLGEVAHFLSTMGFFNLIFISCVPLILYFTKVEQWGSLSSLPWGYLCGLAGLWLVFNILVHVGVVLTYPILISIGTLLSVPGNAAVDVLKHEVIFSVVRLAATCIICLGFLLLLLPEEWDSVTLRFLATIADKKSEDHGEELTESSVHTRSRSRANELDHMMDNIWKTGGL